MFKAGTISASLAAALLGGCTGPSHDVKEPPAPTSAATASTAPEPEPTAAPEPEPTTAPAPEPTAAPTTEPTAVTPPALPAGRHIPVPGTMPASGSVRSGAAACCGKGSCGPCDPLPGKRQEPKPGTFPKTGSARKGADACCGVGTCGPC